MTSAAHDTSVSRHSKGALKGLLTPLDTTVLCWSEGFQVGPELVPHDAEKL